MTKHSIVTGLGIAASLIVAPIAAAQQAPGASPSQPGDLELGCSGLAMEMGKAAQQLAQTPGQTTTAPVSTGVVPNVATAQLEQIGRAYQQQQNAQQLANMQVLAARGGVSSGAASAAIGSVAALQQVAANGGNVQDAARSVATDKISGELARHIPGGAMLGGMLGGMFKKKPKPVPVAAVAAPAQGGSVAQARLSFLGALISAKGCK